VAYFEIVFYMNKQDLASFSDNEFTSWSSSRDDFKGLKGLETIKEMEQKVFYFLIFAVSVFFDR